MCHAKRKEAKGVVGYNRFSKEFQKASKELREGKKSKNANKGLRTRQKIAAEKEQKAQNAFLLGSPSSGQ